MECVVCRKPLESATRAKCAACRMEMHVTCTKVSEENWRKMNAERKSTWVGPCCRSLSDVKTFRDEFARIQRAQLARQTQHFDRLRAQLSEAVAVALGQIQNAVDRMADMRQAEQRTLQQCNDILEKLTNLSKQGGSGIEKSGELPEVKPTIIIESDIPSYLDPLIARVPIFRIDDPMSFLEALYELHLAAPEHFAAIVKRLGAADRNLNRLANECRDNLNFDSISRKILADFTSERTKLKMSVDHLMRPQSRNESFRDYADCILKYGFILKSYEAEDLVKFVLDGANSRARSFFNFQNVPKTLPELDRLANEVEKLERANPVSIEDISDLRNYNKSRFSQNRSRGIDKNRPGRRRRPEPKSSRCAQAPHRSGLQLRPK
ncbi:unnamed protein product [Nesidiocoris tenuis]|uniref:Uncharacterized protein n=1 Tax=Nesidiocoris tenuis TaxID=355587 RepID=A0A6H5GWZ8_9HEMI|nr:unnamed protein product [Nesidiocoris tenuis]